MGIYKFRHFSIPDHMLRAIQRYIERGLPPGHFLAAVIDNNLREAISRADDENMNNLPAYVAYFYNKAPSACWGSSQKREAWVARLRFAHEAQAEASEQ